MNYKFKNYHIIYGLLLSLAVIMFGTNVYNSLYVSNSVQYAYLHYNVIPKYWIDAETWINNNLGQVGNSSVLVNSTSGCILNWWDYGDWDNYFGHVCSVLRGDNQVPPLDYKTAYMFLNANTTELSSFMHEYNSKYLLVASDDFQKLSALNYLSCYYMNETSVSTPVGTSPCELRNMPTYLFYPAQLNIISYYCDNGGNSQFTYIKAQSSKGDTYCLETYKNQIDGKIYDTNLTLISNSNLIPIGQQNINNNAFNVYLMLYTPINKDTCEMQAGLPLFYQSNYYKAMFINCLTGFSQVYPVDGSASQVRIYKINS